MQSGATESQSETRLSVTPADICDTPVNCNVSATNRHDAIAEGRITVAVVQCSAAERSR